MAEGDSATDQSEDWPELQKESSGSTIPPPVGARSYQRPRLSTASRRPLTHQAPAHVDPDGGTHRAAIPLGATTRVCTEAFVVPLHVHRVSSAAFGVALSAREEVTENSLME